MRTIRLLLIFIVGALVNHEFDKPTLLKVYYSWDFNGIGIDFRTDRTYILNNSAIGPGNYFYGQPNPETIAQVFAAGR
jgi:hypothetical protein